MNVRGVLFALGLLFLTSPAFSQADAARNATASENRGLLAARAVARPAATQSAVDQSLARPMPMVLLRQRRPDLILYLSDLQARKITWIRHLRKVT
jgi:hypothetical protein